MPTTLLACYADAQQGSWHYRWPDGREIDGDLGEARPAAALAPALHRAAEQYGRPEALAVAVGPGSFTGLRISVVAVKTFAWLWQRPVHAVDSLLALAAVQGPGLWLPLLPLKKDTTFWALIAIDAAGRIQVLRASDWRLDAQPPQLPAAAAGATVIGPALSSKPQLAAQWFPELACGDAAEPSARGVALAAAQTQAVDWQELEIRYGISSAPELQRQQAGGR